MVSFFSIKRLPPLVSNKAGGTGLTVNQTKRNLLPTFYSHFQFRSCANFSRPQKLSVLGLLILARLDEHLVLTITPYSAIFSSRTMFGLINTLLFYYPEHSHLRVTGLCKHTGLCKKNSYMLCI